jgi:GT2 family glycosyltransferase
MNSEKYSITFACYNQVAYTRQCIDSMARHGVDLRRLVVVDNASTDATRAYLSSLDLGGVILNSGNLGCGIAWNQGVLAQQAEWSVVMNNDVLVSAGWIERLIATAERQGLKIISPAMIEGDLDYDFDSFADESALKMKSALRRGYSHAVCFAVHRSVFMEVGYFESIPKLFGHEDALFFKRVESASIPIGTTGETWLHHFGSITQKAMKLELAPGKDVNLGDRKLYLERLRLNPLQRKLRKLRHKRLMQNACRDEMAAYGMTLFGIRKDGRFIWR